MLCAHITCSDADHVTSWLVLKTSTGRSRAQLLLEKEQVLKKKATVSEVEDDSGVVKKSERTASSHLRQSKMASCQDQDNMEDNVGLASGENHKKKARHQLV